MGFPDENVLIMAFTVIIVVVVTCFSIKFHLCSSILQRKKKELEYAFQIIG